MVKKLAAVLITILLCVLLVFGLSFLADIIVPEYTEAETEEQPLLSVSNDGYFLYSDVPEFDGSTPYVIVNNNIPYFKESQYTLNSYESYGDLDSLGRCTVVCANIGKELMPTTERESIGSVKPTGWQVSKYDFVDGKYLYNRCHLIGYQLTGENANKNNLITGTRFLNVQGMLPFENMVADYIKETGNHVLYRVSPIFRGKELVARGVLMEGWSVEDNGEGICYNVFCYNNQPGVKINYLTGENILVAETEENTVSADYVLNISAKKFHYPSCASVGTIKETNKKEYNGSREELILEGYSPCGSCEP